MRINVIFHTFSYEKMYIIYNDTYKSLLKWKKRRMRQPLILSGARQVGKTWLMKEFGKNEYKNTVYINFDDNPEIAVRVSQKKYGKEGNLLSLPLYLMGMFEENMKTQQF